MQVGTSVIFSDLNKREDIPDDIKILIGELTRRLDVAFGEVLSDLKKQPQIFSVDPNDSANAEIIQGAFTGDVAIYTDNDGDVQVSVFS
jgi:hypothetical protein